MEKIWLVRLINLIINKWAKNRIGEIMEGLVRIMEGLVRIISFTVDILN